jgi:hypothetical protein
VRKIGCFYLTSGEKDWLFFLTSGEKEPKTTNLSRLTLNKNNQSFSPDVKQNQTNLLNLNCNKNVDI